MSRLGKICVILGAGASFDVRSSGSPIIWPSGLGGDAFNGEYKPPLAKSIFDMGHRVYYPILNRYPGAIVVANDISRAVSMEQISLEEALAGIAFHTDPKFRLHYKHVPPYIRDLIFTCTYHYTPYPSNYIRLVSELLSYSPHEVCFLVLNYDDLLEQALRHHTPREYSFENIQDYVALDRGAKVVKLHGSVNWFRTLRQATRGDRDDWFRFLEEFDPLKPPGDETEYRIQDGVTEVLKSPNMLYPILTAPLAGEDPKQFTCPPSHIEVARQFLHDCTKFLIIGTSGFDEDLLELLEDAVPRNRPIQLHFVGGRDAEKAFGRFSHSVPQLTAFRNKPSEDVFRDGFLDYASSSAFKEFANVEAQH